MVLHKDQAGGRHLEDDAETHDRPSSRNGYCTSSDPDANVENVMSGSGEVLGDPFDDLGAGHAPVVQYPQGAMIEVIRIASSWNTAMARNG